MTDGDGVLTGAEIEALSDEELREVVNHTAVYARVSPEHKVRIVAALRKNNDIAAMTGDGVNDAPALKESDIGVSMGITGTDVAKGTADMVLTDDNFASIVSAVEEGRIIYSNIRKFVYFLLSCNIGEILIVFIAILMGLPTPLTAIQLLWLNLVTDSFPALALGTEKGEPDVMQRKPRAASEPIVDKTMAIGILIQSVVLTISVLGSYLLANNVLAPIRGFEDSETILSYARTMAFAMLISCELLRSYSCRSERASLISLGVFSNKTLVYSVGGAFLLLLATLYLPFMRPLFGTMALSIADWSLILVGAVLPLLAGELYKKFILPKIDKSDRRVKPSAAPAADHKKKSSFVDKVAGADPTLEDEYDDIPDMPVNAGADFEEYVEAPAENEAPKEAPAADDASEETK